VRMWMPFFEIKLSHPMVSTGIIFLSHEENDHRLSFAKTYLVRSHAGPRLLAPMISTGAVSQQPHALDAIQHLNPVQGPRQRQGILWSPTPVRAREGEGAGAVRGRGSMGAGSKREDCVVAGSAVGPSPRGAHLGQRRGLGLSWSSGQLSRCTCPAGGVTGRS